MEPIADIVNEAKNLKLDRPWGLRESKLLLLC